MERLKTMAILALLAALAGSIALAATGGEVEVRINARQIEDGRVEFALQQRVDGEWSERILPPSRYFPRNVGHNRWLNSTPMTVSVAEAGESTTSTAETSTSRFVPDVVPNGNRGNTTQGLEVWFSTINAQGHQTVLSITRRSSDSLYELAHLWLFCDHDAPSPNVWGTVRLSTRYDANAVKSLERDSIFAYRLGGAYASDAIRGVGFVRSDNAVEFTIDNFVEEAMRLRWFYVEIPGWDGVITHTFDLGNVWDTPVQRNLENCAS